MRDTLKSSKPILVSFGAAAASGLLATSELEADIIYSGPLNQVVNRGGTATFNFDNDLVNDLRILVGSAATSGGSLVSATFAGYGLNGASVWNNPGTTLGYARKFAPGELIPGIATTAGPIGSMGWYYVGSGILYDPWGAMEAGQNGNGPVTGFLGFTFNGNQGWMRLILEADGTGTPFSATVVDWAYDNSGAEIAAGAVPEPASAGLALLALGAAGLRRKRKSANKD